MKQFKLIKTKQKQTKQNKNKNKQKQKKKKQTNKQTKTKQNNTVQCINKFSDIKQSLGPKYFQWIW